MQEMSPPQTRCMALPDKRSDVLWDLEQGVALFSCIPLVALLERDASALLKQLNKTLEAYRLC